MLYYGKKKFTWGDYATKIFSIINSRHPAAKEFHLVNDRYDVIFSIKDSEHHRRRKKFFQGSKNVFFDAKYEIPPARSFVSFFTNDGNKMRLQEFLFRELQELAKTKNAKFLYTLKEKCFTLNPLDIAQEFACHQHESDTRMLYHANILDNRHDVDNILVDAEDTDVLVMASYAAQQMNKPLSIYRRKGLSVPRIYVIRL